MSDSEDQANGDRYDNNDEQNESADGMDELFGDSGGSADEEVEYVCKPSIIAPIEKQNCRTC